MMPYQKNSAEWQDPLLTALRDCGHFLYHRRGGHLSRFRILQELEYHESKYPDEPFDQKDLQERLHVQSGSISEGIGKMEAMGLVQKSRCENDKRKVSLRLTQAGRQWLEAEKDARREQDAHLFDVLTKEEKEQLLHLVTKLTDSWDVSSTGKRKGDAHV
jgi:DNA-binding MarR family transcriptional regulator